MDFDRADASVGAFSRRVLHHVVNVYSVFSWVVGLLGLLPVWGGERLVWIAAGAAVFSVLPAGYRAWAEAVRALPAVGALAVTCSKSDVNVPIDNRVPRREGHFDFRLDISNPTDSVVFLAKVEVAAWGVRESLFKGPLNTRLLGRHERSGFGDLPLPVRFEPNDRRTDMALFVGVQAVATDEMGFARNLMQETSLTVSIRITSENAARVQGQTEVEVQILLDTYKLQALNAWKANKHTDLIAAAGNLE